MPDARRPVLVIGRQGQLASALQATARPDVVCIGRPDADLGDPARLSGLMREIRPRLVLNAGGFTRVDPAEAQPEEAFRLNCEGPGHLGALCAQAGAVMMHISTDCVFDGLKAGPYTPEDPARPLSVYGRSKLAGEVAVAASCPRHLIVRVSWVFSEYGDNFVPLMLRLARDLEEVTVVSDQVGYPTYCPDLAQGLLAMADRALQPGFTQWGTYHLAGRRQLSRAELAEAIFALSRRRAGPSARVRPVTTAAYAAPARRPLNARLDSASTEAVFGVSLGDWEPGLSRAISRLLPDGTDGKAGGKEEGDLPDAKSR